MPTLQDVLDKVQEVKGDADALGTARTADATSDTTLAAATAAKAQTSAAVTSDVATLEGAKTELKTLIDLTFPSVAPTPPPPPPAA